MLAIIDQKSPKACIQKLEQEFEVIPFHSQNIVMEAISGHPDVFICGLKDELIIAPNTPREFINQLKVHNITYTLGERVVSQDKYGAVAYNIRHTNDHIIHNFSYTDKRVLNASAHLKAINVKQAFTGCSLTALSDQHFITSDRGIAKVLDRMGFVCLYVDPASIELPGLNHGLFGGCSGLHGQNLYINGNLSLHPFAGDVYDIAAKANIKVINLGDEKMYDGGGIIFIDNS